MVLLEIPIGIQQKFMTEFALCPIRQDVNVQDPVGKYIGGIAMEEKVKLSLDPVVLEQRQHVILPQHAKNHPTTMTDVIGHTMGDIVVAKVHVALIQHWLLVLLTAVELGS